jgi:hypothetical protein
MINAATFLPSSEELSYFTRSGPSARSADGPPKWIPFGSKIHRSKDLADVRAMAQQPQEKKVGARRTNVSDPGSGAFLTPETYFQELRNHFFGL